MAYAGKQATVTIQVVRQSWTRDGVRQLVKNIEQLLTVACNSGDFSDYNIRTSDTRQKVDWVAEETAKKAKAALPVATVTYTTSKRVM